MTTSRPADISVVIPTWGEAGNGLVETCLATLFDTHADIQSMLEVVVVHDGPDDLVVDGLRRVCEGFNAVRVVATEQRTGFAHACNTGIGQASGQFVALVNNDIEFYEPCLWGMVNSAIRFSAGVVGCRLLYPDRTVQHGGVVYVRGDSVEGVPGWFDHLARGCREFDPNAYCIAPSLVTGALMVIPRTTFLRCGLLDERFGFTCEDIDLCLRSREAGMDVVYQGLVGAIHHEGKTRGATPEEKSERAPEIIEREQAALRFLHEKWVGVDFQRLFAYS